MNKAATGASQLRADSLSFFESLVMGVSASAPAYSIAITTAVLIAAVGNFAPASLAIFSIPMLGIANAYRMLSIRDVDAGASYRWTSAVFGRFLGFYSGWTLLFATLLFMVSGSIPIATATLNFIAPNLIGNVVATAGVASLWFALVAAIVITGITLSSRVLMVMTSVQILILVVVLGAAFAHVSTATVVNPPDWSWLGSGLSAGGLAGSALIAIYYYWGWDVTSNLGEETVGGGKNAGRGGLVSIFVTIFLYVSFAVATLFLFSIRDTGKLTDNLVYNIAIASGLGHRGGLLASGAVILSSIATLEATMLMFSRTLFSMGRDGVMPRFFGEVHPKTRSPARAINVIVGLGLALIWASSLLPSVSVIISSAINALGLHVDYYFGLAGLAAAWTFRTSYRESFGRWLALCLFPALSSLLLIGLGVYAISTFDLLTKVVALGGFALGLLFYRPRARGQPARTP